jgi:hypothetical protein
MQFGLEIYVNANKDIIIFQDHAKNVHQEVIGMAIIVLDVVQIHIGLEENAYAILDILI